MGLSNYRIQRKPAAAEILAGVVAEMLQEVRQQGAAQTAMFTAQTRELQAANRQAAQLMTLGEQRAHAEAERQAALSGVWQQTEALLAELDAARGTVAALEERLAAVQAAPMAVPGALVPGAVAPLTNALWPNSGPTELKFLHDQILDVQATRLPLTGGTMTGTLTFGTDAPFSLNGRYKIDTDNLGAPGHEATGPRLFITDIPDNRLRFQLNSLGQVQLFLQDESLANNSVGHGLQVRRRATGSGTVIGLGTGIQFFVTDDDEVDQEAGNVQVALTAITPGAVNSYIQLVARSAGSTVEMLRCIGSSGEVRAIAAAGWLSAPNFTASAQHGQVSAGDDLFDGAGGAFAGVAGGTIYAGNVTSGFSGNFIDIQRAGVPLYRMAGSGQQIITIQDALTTTPSAALIVAHILSSGTPGTGFGAGITIQGRDDASAPVTIGQIRCEETNPAAGAVDANMVFQHIKANVVTESFRIKPDSNLLAAFKVLATGGLGVGNSAAATTPGSVTKKIEVFDQTGASIGFLAVYASIA